MTWLWPRSLKGQMLLAVALALLLAQTIHAVLLYRALSEQRDAALIHTAALRLMRADRGGSGGFWTERATASPLGKSERRDSVAEARLREILAEQEVETTDIVVLNRHIAADATARERLRSRHELMGRRGLEGDRVMVAALRRKSDGSWLVARVMVPPGGRLLVLTLIGQTLLIYAVLVGAIAFILRRITRPLAVLTGRTERFAGTRDRHEQIAAEGPEDVRRLIVAHNAMEERIGALLDEKDVMLGAIGHDLKTPLSALRVRIEGVEDESERSRMAATITEISASLDNILALARSGRPTEPREIADLFALAASLVEEYEDLDEPVTLEPGERMKVPLRGAWLKGALRNLIDNALRYGRTARVSLARDGGMAVIRVNDDGPGIPEADMESMLRPFTRGEPSRNSATGGAGLGLALAKAIAGQHGGALELSNRRAPDGSVAGLSAALRLPLV